MKERKRHYENFTEEELILRDHLAMDRTILANERTLLSYVRTSLAIVVVGATLIHFFQEAWIQGVGIMLAAVGGLILLLGYLRFKKMESTLKKIQRS